MPDFDRSSNAQLQVPPLPGKEKEGISFELQSTFRYLYNSRFKIQDSKFKTCLPAREVKASGRQVQTLSSFTG
jgi:hypothetical protein